MKSRLAEIVRTAVTVARVAYEHELRYPAAAFAYYAFVSFLPLLVLLAAVLGETMAAEIQSEIPNFFTPQARELVSESLTTASGRLGAMLLSIVALAWSGTNMAVDFQTVVERVEETTEEPLSVQLRDAVGILGSFALTLCSITVAGVVFALMSADPLVEQGWPIVLFATFTISFIPLYYLPSRVVTSLSGALPGALAAAFGWTVLIAVVQFYAAHAARYAIYGILSGIIIVLTSFYLAAIVLMLGVVVNATLVERLDVPQSLR